MSWNKSLPQIENLVLNGTRVDWPSVLQLARLLPALKELHICANGRPLCAITLKVLDFKND